MSGNKVDLEQIANDLRDFIEQFESLQLATVSVDGLPEASYAPYLRVGRDFYIYVSELSRHTRNLHEVPRASVMFIEAEADAGHLFARRRLTYACRCEEVPRGSAGFDQTLTAFEKRFGQIMQMLRNLEDFHLFRMTPEQGTFVTGFARAFVLVGDELDRVRHINDTGHRAKDSDTAEQMDDQVRDQAEPA